jgi:hypothetical protein
MRPLARTRGLLIRELPEETLVYDLDRHQAHCLNRSAGLVFRLCDGRHTPLEIAAALEPGVADDAEREAVVRLALAQLGDAGLTLPDAAAVVPTAAPRNEITVEASRRDLLRRVGTALLLPAIASVLAPTPAQAASLCVIGPFGECAGQPDGTRCWCATPDDCPTHTCQGNVCTGLNGPCP